ncbi:HAD-IB family hydrolase [Clostridium tarantellae]|uniref:HAD-IB family hydrolase n=1 Tax=Clostridium tarantellae TaxID=39493 RepID=A0A6I1MHE2_9CLOT|nr:HAD-IB family hydrolase [Clostridium tarantellae]MPQ42580.1 HAD-IB family hydrolase [Clostridium tarantellae]
MKKIKVALFDIDKTLIKGDSMFHLLKYTVKKYPKSTINLPSLFFTLVSYKLGMITTKKAKEKTFFTLNYLNEIDLKDFYDISIRTKMFASAIEEMNKLKAKGYYILLVSASPECYLKYFEEEDVVDFVIGTKLKKKEEKFLNEIVGENCKGEEKVKRITYHLKECGYEIDKKNSVAYSDSLSDIPMFNLVDKAYLINYKSTHNVYEILKWK